MIVVRACMYVAACRSRNWETSSLPFAEVFWAFPETPILLALHPHKNLLVAQGDIELLYPCSQGAIFRQMRLAEFVIPAGFFPAQSISGMG